jgi:hypothetical protein
MNACFRFSCTIVAITLAAVIARAGETPVNISGLANLTSLGRM